MGQRLDELIRQIAKNPTPEVYVDLALAYEKLGEEVEARTLLQEGRALFPEHADLQRHLEELEQRIAVQEGEFDIDPEAVGLISETPEPEEVNPELQEIEETPSLAAELPEESATEGPENEILDLGIDGESIDPPEIVRLGDELPEEPTIETLDEIPTLAEEHDPGADVLPPPHESEKTFEVEENPDEELESGMEHLEGGPTDEDEEIPPASLPSKRTRRWPSLRLSLILLVGGGLLAYFIFLKDRPAETNSSKVEEHSQLATLAAEQAGSLSSDADSAPMDTSSELTLTEEEIEHLYQRGIEQLESGEIEEALRSFYSVLKADPSYQSAATYFEQAREEVKIRREQNAKLLEARTAYQEGDYVNAVRLFWRIHLDYEGVFANEESQLGKEFLIRSYFQLSFEALRRRDLQEAWEHLGEIEKLDPENRGHRQRMARLRAFIERHRGARESLRYEQELGQLPPLE